MGSCEITKKIILDAIFPPCEDIFNAQMDPTGFEVSTTSKGTITFTDGSRTFQIEPLAGQSEFVIWRNGKKYSKMSAETIVIPDVEGLHYIYYDATQALAVATNPGNETIAGVIIALPIVAIVYWDATNNESVWFNDERHLLQMSGGTHAWLHFNEGTRYISGLALGDFSIDQSGALDAHAQFSIAAGRIIDEDLQSDSTTVASTTGAPILYKDGAGGDWRVDTNAGFSVTTTGTGRLAWNEYTGGAWQLTEVSNTKYVLCHIISTPGVDQQVYSIVGQAEYQTKNQAREGALTEVNNLITEGLPGPEFIFVGTVIFQTADAYGNAVKARTITTDTGDNYVDWRDQSLSPATAPASHNNLADLQGGQAGQYYHSTKTQWQGLGLDSTVDEIQIGNGASASIAESISIGKDSSTVGNTSIALGSGATVTGGNRGIAIGAGANVNESYGIAVGRNAAATGQLSAAFGYGATASHQYSVCLGYNAVSTLAGQIVLGGTGTTAVIAEASFFLKEKVLATADYASHGQIWCKTDCHLYYKDSSGVQIKLNKTSHTEFTDVGSNTHSQIDTAISNSVSHIASSANPHTVTHTQVGSATAQWNANKLVGYEIDMTAIADDKILKYKTATGKWECEDDEAGAGGGFDPDVEELAIGLNAAATGNDSTSLGFNTDSDGDRSFAGGFGSQAAGDASVAIGDTSTTSLIGQISIGDGSVVTGTQAINLGSGSATADFGISIGNLSNVTANNSINIGYNVTLSNVGSINIGTSNSTPGLYSTQIGATATASAQYCLAMGYLSEATSNNSTAIGYNAEVSTNIQGTSIGVHSICTGSYGLAMGASASCTGNNSVVAGRSAACTHARAISLGYSASVTVDDGICLGDSICSGARGIVIGKGSSVTSPEGIAIGDVAVASADEAIAIGDATTAAHANSVALGQSAATTRINEIVLGSTTNDDVTIFGGLFLEERASAYTDKSGFHQFWVRSSDGAPMFTGDDGVDYILDKTAA